MNLTKTYAAVVDGLDKQAEEEVGKFSSDFLTAVAYGDAAKVVELVKEAMHAIAADDSSFEELFGALDLAEKYGSPMEKIAVERIMPVITKAMKDIDDEFTKTAQTGAGHVMHLPTHAASHAMTHAVPYSPAIHIKLPKKEGLSSYQKGSLALGAAGLALSAAPFLMKLLHKHSHEKKIEESLRHVLAEHPELKDNPRLPFYFQSIASMAPTVAAQPALAAHVLKTLHQIGPEGLSPKLIKELREVEEALTSSQEHNVTMSEAGKSAMNFGKILADVGKSKPKVSKEDDGD